MVKEAEVNHRLIEQVCLESAINCLLEKAALGFDSQAYAHKCSQIIQAYRQEFQQIANLIQPKTSQTFMFEVLCSKDSELTRQGMQQGLTVKRVFCFAEGDLSAREGRRNLFCHLARDHPEHIWISSTCGADGPI